MPITTLLSGLPARTMDQPAFDTAWAKLMTDLPTFGGEVNATVAALNSLAAGGAYAIPYIFDSATTDADPGAGKLRLSSATQNTATVMRLSVTAGGQDYTSVISTFDASTSAVKGSIRLVKLGDPTKWLTFDVTVRASPTGYRNITVVNTGSSAANPFANGDSLMLLFQRSGNAGSNGSIRLIAQATVSAPVASVDFLNVFTAEHDKYIIEIQGMALANFIWMRLANSGAVDSAANYGISATSTGTLNMTGIAFGLTINTGLTGISGTIEVRNVNATSAKTIHGSTAGSAANGSHEGGSFNGSYSKAATVSGFQIFNSSAGNITAGTIRVYGVLNT